MKRHKKLDKVIVVRIPDKMRKDLERDAEEHGRTVAQSARFYIQTGLQGKK